MDGTTFQIHSLFKLFIIRLLKVVPLPIIREEEGEGEDEEEEGRRRRQQQQQMDKRETMKVDELIKSNERKGKRTKTRAKMSRIIYLSMPKVYTRIYYYTHAFKVM